MEEEASDQIVLHNHCIGNRFPLCAVTRSATALLL
jgi:hypothetical protein